MTSDIAKQVALKTILGTCVPKPATLHVQMICVTDRVDTAQSAASKIQTSYVGQHCVILDDMGFRVISRVQVRHV